MDPRTPTSSQTDALSDLVRRMQSLEETAFDEFVDAYAARLYGFLLRFTGIREDAEDLMQEVFVRVVRVIGRYEHDGRFDAWLFRIAANLARDRHRATARRPDVASLEAIEGAGGPCAEAKVGSASACGFEMAEAMDRIQALMPRLPDAEREVILLRHYGHLTFAEIAAMMGTPLGTALARSHRGLGKLRAWMEADS